MRETSLGGSRFRFGETLWTVVRRAREHSREALEELIRAYWKPVYFFIRSRGRAVEDAKDLTQQFFAMVLERDCLKDVSPDKGKFKTFLLVLLERFLINEAERARAKKRGGGKLALDLDRAESQFHPAADDTPEKVFERGWAEAVLERAYEALRKELCDSGREPQFQALALYLKERKSPQDISRQLAVSAKTVENWLYRTRKLFRETLLAQIAQYVSTRAEAEEELADILSRLR